MTQMNIHSTKDIRFAVGYFKPGEDVDRASIKTQLKNWVAGTFIGKLFKMDPPKCLCVRDANTGRHIATDITSARYGQFAKVDLSSTQPSKVSQYQPPPDTRNTPLEDRGSGDVNVSKFHGPVRDHQELQTAKQEIGEGFKKEFWNRDQMTVAIYAKMVNRDKSGGEPIRAFVTEFDPQNPKTCEFGKVLDGIKQGIKDGSLKEGQRFQVAVQNGAHWTAIDAKIINGEPHFFVMDAAQASTADLCIAIQDAFPNCTMYQFMDKNISQIQFDDNSCSRFTLDHLSVMSRDGNLFERLEQTSQTGAFRNLGRNGQKDFLVPSEHLPPGTFRMLQSHSNLDKLDDNLKDRISSPSKQKTEYQQALSHTVIDFERGKLMNLTAQAKKESFTAKAMELLDRLTLEQFNKVMTYRSGEGVLF